VTLAFYDDMPSEAKNQKGIVFADKCNDIFDENKIAAARLLHPLTLYKPIDEQKRAIRSRKRRRTTVPDGEAFISLATFHILNAMKFVSEHERLDLNDESDSERARERAIELVWEVVQSVMSARGELYTHDRFFKEKATGTLTQNHARNHYGQLQALPGN